MKESPPPPPVSSRCISCGYPKNSRPNLTFDAGVCSACRNYTNRARIDFEARQVWLRDLVASSRSRGTSGFDCAVAVSGGKDSTAIVKMLFEDFGVSRALLIHLPKVFTLTKVGQQNLENLTQRYNVDLLSIQLNKQEVLESVRNDFFETLNPGKRIGQDIYDLPATVCRRLGIPLLFYGENGEYEYGSAEILNAHVDSSSSEVEAIYLGAIVPYSAHGWYEIAKSVGFRDLSDTREWYRQGQIEGYSEIDSFGHAIAVWTKFVKFGAQRVSDISSRLVRERRLPVEAAIQLSMDLDWVVDPCALEDFCETLHISTGKFWETVDRHANHNLVVKDAAGNWKRRDLLKMM